MPVGAETEACPVDRNLIFDLGMHRAMDTRFYLEKGFRVVAVEANPSMISAAQDVFKTYINSGQLTIIGRALWLAGVDEITFYLNAEKDDWSSGFRNFAEKGGHKSTEVRVRTITLSDLFESYGTPYYIKCDIEGADQYFVQQLLLESGRPRFVSVEAVSLSLLAGLIVAGYDRVQIVNQALNALVLPPKPAREGVYVDTTFNGHMSGLFGLELPPERWRNFQLASELFLDFQNLKARDETLAHGWLDFHVTTACALEQADGRRAD